MPVLGSQQVPGRAVDMPRTVTDDELFHSPPKFPKSTPGRFCFPNTTSCADMTTHHESDSDDKWGETADGTVSTTEL